MANGFTSAALDPAAANALAASLQGKADKPIPLIPLPPDTFVELPGGFFNREQELVTTAQVRELTGEDEEAITRAQASGNFGRVVSTLLRCGVEMLGDKPATEQALKGLLIGDRDALILGIRRATYGDVVDLGDTSCPHCGDEFHLSMTLDDFPIRRLEDPSQRTWDVPLRKGGHARVRLPIGGDQDEIFNNPKLSVSEQHTILLSRCVLSLIDSEGEETPVIGIRVAKGLGMADRSTIIKFLAEKQPGPRYDQLQHTCEACGEEFPLAVTVGDLFRL